MAISVKILENGKISWKLITEPVAVNLANFKAKVGKIYLKPV